MFKVLVVDDEILIQEGIAEGIDWDRLGCDKPFLAVNGFEAITILNEHCIDIVITDVKMPGMNGLELAKWVYENKKGTYVIILSGYDDFKYAQNALHYGVTEYILKPTKFEELENAIEQVKKKIREQKKLNVAYKISREIIEQSKRQAIIDSIIFERISNAERTKLVFENTDQGNLHRIILLHVCDCSKDYIKNNSYIAEYIKYIDQIISDITGDKCIKVFIQYQSYEILIYLSSDSNLISEDIFSQTSDQIINALKEKAYGFAPFDIVIGGSHTDNNIGNLKNLYLEAAEQCDMEKQRFLSVESQHPSNKTLKELLPPDFQSHLHNRNLQMLKKDIDEFFQNCLDKTGVYIKGIAIELINYMLICIGREILPEYMEMQKVYQSIIKANNINEVSMIVKDFLRNLCQLTGSAAENKSDGSAIADRIAAYIKRNFFNDLSLESVAEHFYISPGHLSRLLRKYYNTTFLGFLTRVRIENAKILLQNPRYKVCDVCTMVGFNDSKYFSQAFKKLTGKTPSDFK